MALRNSVGLEGVGSCSPCLASGRRAGERLGRAGAELGSLPGEGAERGGFGGRGPGGILGCDWSAPRLSPCAAQWRHNIQARGAGPARSWRKRRRCSCGAWGRRLRRPRRQWWPWREAPTPRSEKALGPDPTEGPMEVAAGGGCGAGPPLLLSDSEQQCYSELFARCASTASGGPGPGPHEATRVAPGTVTAAAGPVADLFRASQLPPETLHQVCLCALLSLTGLWGQCLWEEWGNNDYSRGYGRRWPGRQKKGGGSAAEDGGDALVPRDTSLRCSSSPPSLVLGCALRPLKKV